jgi:hypothetical protein
MGGYPYAWACAMATAVIVWNPPSPSRRAWPEVWKGCVASSRIVRPRVVVPWVYVLSTRSLASRSSRARVLSGRHLTRGGARHPPCPCSGGETWADAAEGPPALAWPKCAPPGRGRIQRWTRRSGGVALGRGAFESPGAAANPDLCRGSSESSRGRGRPRTACASPVVRLPARRRSSYRRG